MLESFKKNKKGIILMIISSICACTGQMFWKLATSSDSLIYLLVGFALYGLGALIMIIAYKFGKLSVLQPMLSLNYILTIILGVLILNENITVLKVVGILVITAGVFMIGGGDEE